MIGIIDYGMGNLRSVQKALERVGGGDVRLVTKPAQLAKAQKIVLPGVAAFGDAIAQLRSCGLDKPLVKAINGGTPFLGFCLGLQLLFEVGYEDGEHKGLGVLGGKVAKFDFSGLTGAGTLRIPHMGWNSINISKPCPALAGIKDGSYVYFAHSYHPLVSDNSIVATTTDYGYRFTSSVWRDNIFATQFHPEKSQAVGLEILKNFIGL